MTNKPAEPAAAHCVTIGSRVVGPGEPTYVIAEAGVNHDGSVHRALRLVDAAADAGADAVKFQVFRARELTTASATTADYQKRSGGSSQRDLLARLELSDHEFQRVRDHCTQRRIEFLATPFGPHDVDRLLALNVSALKIASTDLNNTPLLERAAVTGLPLVVSTGAATAEEIATGVARLQAWHVGRRLVLLHCVSSYPTPLDAANLRAIAALRRSFNVACGFSDHTTTTQAGAWAVAAGASILEKHLTLDHTASGPDHAMSLEPAALQAYIASVREVERALGTGQLGMSELEADVRAVARKSVVAACDIDAGTRLRSEMLTVKRPAGGIEPDQLETLLGRRLAIDAPQDTTLTWDMIQ